MEIIIASFIKYHMLPQCKIIVTSQRGNFVQLCLISFKDNCLLHHLFLNNTRTKILSGI